MACSTARAVVSSLLNINMEGPAPEIPPPKAPASIPDFFTASELPAFEALRSKTRWRIYGACCMAYGLLTSGRTDVAIDSKLKLWDYAPFIPMIQGAGGCITDWQGRARDESSLDFSPNCRKD